MLLVIHQLPRRWRFRQDMVPYPAVGSKVIFNVIDQKKLAGTEGSGGISTIALGNANPLGWASSDVELPRNVL